MKAVYLSAILACVCISITTNLHAQLVISTANNFVTEIVPLFPTNEATDKIFSNRIKNDSTNWDVLVDDDGSTPFQSTDFFYSDLQEGVAEDFTMTFTPTTGTLGDLTLSSRGAVASMQFDMANFNSIILAAGVIVGGPVTANASIEIFNLEFDYFGGSNFALPNLTKNGPGETFLLFSDFGGISATPFELRGSYIFDNGDAIFGNLGDTDERMKITLKGAELNGPTTNIVPEPSTYMALIICLGLVGYVRLRKSRKN